MLVGTDSPAFRCLIDYTQPKEVIIETKPYSKKFLIKKLFTLSPLTILANWWLKREFNKFSESMRLLTTDLFARHNILFVPRVEARHVRGKNVVIFGSSIIRRKTLNAAKEMVNLHLGWLPVYRGCKSDIWALYNHGPIGATLHEVDLEIDAGKIIDRIKYYKYVEYPHPIWQGRPKNLAELKWKLLTYGVYLINQWKEGKYEKGHMINTGGSYYSTPPWWVIWIANKNLKCGVV